MTRTCILVSMSSLTTSSSPPPPPKKKQLKGGESQNQVVLPIFVEYALILLLFAWGSWPDILHICGKFIPKVLHGVALVNYNEQRISVL